MSRCDRRLGFSRCLDLKAASGSERQRINDYESSCEAWMPRSQGERQHASKAVADHDRTIETLRPNVFGEFRLHGR